MVNVSDDQSSIQKRKQAALKSGTYLVDWVENELRRQMAKLAGDENARFPRVHTLAESFDVSQNTVRNAMGRLKKQHLVHSVQGRGTFVAPASRKQTQTVLIFGKYSSHPYETMAVGVLSEILRRRGYIASLEFCPSLPPEEQWDTLLEHHENLFGTFVIGHHADNKKLLRFFHEKRGEPVVLIGDGNEPARRPAVCDNVAFDNRVAGYVAADYLIRQGHERIMTAINGARSLWGRDLIWGCADAFSDHGLKFREEWNLDLSLRLRNPDIMPVWDDDLSSNLTSQQESGWVFRRQGDEKQFDEVLESADPPTALICNIGCEAQLHDVAHHYFHDHFSPSDIVNRTTEEATRGFFPGYRNDAIFVTSRFRLLAERAVDMLSRRRGEKAVPRRELIEDVHLYRRHEGYWQELDIVRE